MIHINRLKKKLVDERRLHRTMRTMLASEIESKNTLEKIMRLCVDDVKGEITRKSQALNHSTYHGRGKKGRQEMQAD